MSKLLHLNLRTILTFLTIIIGFSSLGALANSAQDRSHVRQKIFTDYDQTIIPDNVTVQVGLSLIHFDVKPELNRLDVFAWMRYGWNDKRLMWNASDYNGVDVLRVPSQDIWKPDIALYNSYGKDKPCSPTQALVYPTGEIIWVPKCEFEANCDMAGLMKNSSVRQSCFLKFGSWTFDGFMMGLELYQNKSYVELDDLWDTSDWRITGSNTTRIERYYACCPEPYLNIKFHMEFERKKERMARNGSARVEMSTIAVMVPIFISIVMAMVKIF